MTLLRRLVPAMPWVHWVPVGVAIGLLAWLMSRLQPDFDGRQLYLRAGLLLAALGYSFAFDDPAAETTDGSPAPLRTRRLLRALIAFVPWAVLIAVLLAFGATGMKPMMVLSPELTGSEFPVGRLLLEAATIAAWGLGTAACVSYLRDDKPGWIASSAVLAYFALAWMVPDKWKPWASPSEPRWSTALPWWWVALAIGVLTAVVFSWDARRTRMRSGFAQSGGR